MKNNVLHVIPRPKWKSVVTSKWIYKIKNAVDGSIDKYKERFVARGFSQKEGIDYGDLCTSSQINFDQINTLSGCNDEMEDILDGCQDCFLEWCSIRGSVCGESTQF